LLSYPLHPPARPAALRTAHFPGLRIPALFVHGTRDPFGSVDELRAALTLVPAPTRLHVVEGAGHDLGRRRTVVAEAAATGLLGLTS
jgi:predicted alpha/beta-hydrolase family hydrolase